VVLTVVAEKGAVAGFRVTDVLAKPLDPKPCRALRQAGVFPERRGAVLVVDDDESCSS